MTTGLHLDHIHISHAMSAALKALCSWRFPVMLLMLNSQMFKHSIMLRTLGISNFTNGVRTVTKCYNQIPKSVSCYNVYLNNFTLSSNTVST